MMAGIKYWDVMYDITSQYLCAIINYWDIIYVTMSTFLTPKLSLAALGTV